MCLDVEGVVEFKIVYSKDLPDEVAASLKVYSGGRLVTGIEIMSTSKAIMKYSFKNLRETKYTIIRVFGVGRRDCR